MDALTSGVFSVALYALLSLLTRIVIRLYIHPLSRIPGPKLAAVSNIWQAYHVRNGRARELGKDIHKKYGPIVRVGPNEVWCNSAEAFKAIYSTFMDTLVLTSRQYMAQMLTHTGPGSGCDKSDFYRMKLERHGCDILCG